LLCSAAAPTAIYTPSLHDALPILAIAGSLAILTAALTPAPHSVRTGICGEPVTEASGHDQGTSPEDDPSQTLCCLCNGFAANARSEEYTSELQSRENIVCRLLLEK